MWGIFVWLTSIFSPAADLKAALSPLSANGTENLDVHFPDTHTYNCVDTQTHTLFSNNDRGVREGSGMSQTHYVAC